MSEERVRPFYCGTQAADWKCANCYRCTKGYDDDTRKWNCVLEFAIDEAFISDGMLSAEHAKRIGACGKQIWQCTEFVAV